MGSNLYEKGFLIVAISIIALLAIIIASMVGLSKYTWAIIFPFLFTCLVLWLTWDKLMVPERMFHLDSDVLIIYPNLFAILFYRGRRLKLKSIQRISLVEGYLAIHLQPRSMKSVEIWFPDDITNAMQVHLKKSLPNVMVDRLIDI